MSAVIEPPVSNASADVAKSSTAWTAAWLALGASAAVLLTVLWRVWMSLPEMNDRFLIPLAAAWLVNRNRPHWRSIPQEPNRWGLLFVGLGAALAPPAWFLLVQVGPRVALLWWLMTALALAIMGLTVLQFGWRRFWVNAFPIAFCFLALPTPDRLQTPLQIRLKEYTTSATATVLPAIGIPAERRGHTLLLPSGQLGVVDACSGVRSVTALTAIALFVAYLRGFTVVRTAILAVATLGIVVASNSLRVIATGVLQEWLGPQWTHGAAHDVLGYMVILVGLALIVAVSSFLARGLPERNHEWKPAQTGPKPTRGWLAFLAISLSLGGCFWAEQFRFSENRMVSLSSLPVSIDGWEGSDRPVPEIVSDLLKCDQLLHRVYVSELGQEAEVYVMYWATPASTAHMHHPDVCMPLQGWCIDVSDVETLQYHKSRPPIRISRREYSQDGVRQMVFYWTQNGAELLPDGKEDPEQVQEYRWMYLMLTGQASPSRTSRLSVRVDMELTGDPIRQHKVLTEISAAIAREVYSLLPWATPQR